MTTFDVNFIFVSSFLFSRSRNLYTICINKFGKFDISCSNMENRSKLKGSMNFTSFTRFLDAFSERNSFHSNQIIPGAAVKMPNSSAVCVETVNLFEFITSIASMPWNCWLDFFINFNYVGQYQRVLIKQSSL